MTMRRRTDISEVHLFRKTTLTQVYELMQPVLLLCKIFGLFSINRILEHKQVVLKTGKRDWVYFTFYFITNLLIAISSIKMCLRTEANSGNIRSLWLLYLVLVHFNSVSVIIIIFWRRQRLCDVIKCISKVDLCFEQMQVRLNNTKMYNKIVTVLVVFCSWLIVRMTLTILFLDVALAQKLLILVSLLVRSAFILLLSVEVYVMSERFSTVNNTFTSLKCIHGTNPGDIRLLSDNLRTLCRLHAELYKTFRSLNKTLNFPMLISTLTGVINGFIALFFTYVLVMPLVSVQFEITRLFTAITFINWGLYEGFEGALIIKLCSNAASNANTTGAFLHYLQRKVDIEELDEQFQIHSLELLQRNLVTTVMGMIVIDFSLYYSILGFAITFLLAVVERDQLGGKT